jgi:hypothetical protein
MKKEQVYRFQVLFYLLLKCNAKKNQETYVQIQTTLE